MDDFGNIIIIVIVAGAMIISAITKNAKKKLSQDNPEKWNEANSEDDLERSLHETRNTFDGEIIPIHDEPWSYDMDAVNKMASDQTSSYKNHNLTAMSHFKNVDEEIKDIDNNEEGRSCETDIIASFNVRDAVLYSELLKPKFKD